MDVKLFTFLTLLLLAHTAYGQNRSELFFREDWAETPPALPITQEHVTSDNLTLKQYGPGGEQIKKSHHEEPPLDPYYVWSGRAPGPWVVTLRRGDAHVDLSGPGARIQWRARQSGFRRLHVVLKLAGGTWLVSDAAHGASDAWQERAFDVNDLRWRQLDIEAVTEGRRVEAPDLSRVAEVGFTDLMRGGGSPASSRVDWIAVWGRPVTAQQPARGRR